MNETQQICNVIPVFQNKKLFLKIQTEQPLIFINYFAGTSTKPAHCINVKLERVSNWPNLSVTKNHAIRIVCWDEIGAL